MSAVDWDILNQRRSCGFGARRAEQARGVPTTPTTASVIGGIQAQEAIKYLHGLDALLGRGFVFDGAQHTSYAVAYTQKQDCPWHDTPAPIETTADLGHTSRLRDVWAIASSRFGGLDALDFGREAVWDQTPVHSLDSSSPMLERTVCEVGLPPWDIIWARRGNEQLGIALAGDRERVLAGSEENV